METEEKLRKAMDYAILRTGGKQYRVTPGNVIDVDRLRVDEGSFVQLTDVLAVSRDGQLVLGNPLVQDASVIAQVQLHDKTDKITVFKYKRKVRYRRKKGHRQDYTRLAITGILIGEEEIGIPEVVKTDVIIEDELVADVEEVSEDLDVQEGEEEDSSTDSSDEVEGEVIDDSPGRITDEVQEEDVPGTEDKDSGS